MKTRLLIPSVIIIVIISFYFGITFTHDYIYYVSHLEKIEFEETYDNCYDEDCKKLLENNGFSCQLTSQFGYVCIPPINEQRISQRQDYWDQLLPPSYAYMDLVYDDKEFAIGLLKEIEFIDENKIKAIFSHEANGENYFTYTLPEQSYHLTRTLNVGDTFVPRCHNQNLMVYKLHDIVISDDVSYAVFVYRIGTTDIDRCVFPELLENSFDVRFDI
jgi:hypothetical protein